MEITNILTTSLLSSGGLALKHLVFCAKGLISRLTTSWWLTTLNGAAVSTELIKIKGDVEDPPQDVTHSGSYHPQGISAPSFRTAPL